MTCNRYRCRQSAKLLFHGLMTLSLCTVYRLPCIDCQVIKPMSGAHPRCLVCHAEKDEEGTKLLESVQVVTAKTGTTVAFSK